MWTTRCQKMMKMSSVSAVYSKGCRANASVVWWNSPECSSQGFEPSLCLCVDHSGQEWLSGHTSMNDRRMNVCPDWHMSALPLKTNRHPSLPPRPSNNSLPHSDLSCRQMVDPTRWVLTQSKKWEKKPCYLLSSLGVFLFCPAVSQLFLVVVKCHTLHWFISQTHCDIKSCLSLCLSIYINLYYSLRYLLWFGWRIMFHLPCDFSSVINWVSCHDQ